VSDTVDIDSVMSSSKKLYGHNLEKVSNSGTSTDIELVKSLHLGSGNYVIIPSLVRESKTANFLLYVDSHKPIQSW